MYLYIYANLPLWHMYQVNLNIQFDISQKISQYIRTNFGNLSTIEPFSKISAHLNHFFKSQHTRTIFLISQHIRTVSHMRHIHAPKLVLHTSCITRIWDIMCIMRAVKPMLLGSALYVAIPRLVLSQGFPCWNVYVCDICLGHRASCT